MNHLRRALITVLLAPGITLAQGEAKHARYEEALRFSNDWLDQFVAGNSDATFDLLAPTFQRNLTREVWRKEVEKERADLGKQTSRTLRRIVWYQDPANAPLPGLYAAVEYDSVFENSDLHFQYLMLHSQDNLPFRVMRREVILVRKKARRDEE